MTGPALPHHPAPVAGGDASDALWRFWPWANWIVALVIPFHSLFIGSGWETIFFVVSSPVLVPAFGLLESAPRFILRRRGHRATPRAIACLLPLHWAAVLVLLMSHPGSTDAAPTPSGLSRFSGRPVLEDVEALFAGISVIAALASGIAILVLSFVLRPSPRAPGQVRRVWTAPFIASTAVAALFLSTAPALAAELTARTPDAAGDSPRDVEDMPTGERIALLEQRYEAAQQELSKLRGALSDGDWTTTGFALTGDTSYEVLDEYGIELEFVTADPTTLDRSQLESRLEELGYRDSGYYWKRPDGATVDVDQAAENLSVTFTSPRWWGDGHALRDEIDTDVRSLIDTRYPAEEFPELRSVHAQSIAENWTEILTDRYMPYNFPELEEGDRDPDGRTRDEALGAEQDRSTPSAEERLGAAQQALASFVTRTGGVPAPEDDADSAEELLRETGIRRESSYSDPKDNSPDQYFVALTETIDVSAQVDWKQLASELDSEGWEKVISASDGIAAKSPDGNVVVAYTVDGQVVVGLRTPTWWGAEAPEGSELG